METTECQHLKKGNDLEPSLFRAPESRFHYLCFHFLKLTDIESIFNLEFILWRHRPKINCVK